MLPGLGESISGARSLQRLNGRATFEMLQEVERLIGQHGEIAGRLRSGQNMALRTAPLHFRIGRMGRIWRSGSRPRRCCSSLDIS